MLEIFDTNAMNSLLLTCLLPFASTMINAAITPNLLNARFLASKISLRSEYFDTYAPTVIGVNVKNPKNIIIHQYANTLVCPNIGFFHEP